MKLEQTVRKLQSVLEVSPEQVEEIPSPISRMHELEQENELLNGEVVELRRQLELKNSPVQQDASRQDTPLPDDEQSSQELQPSTTGDADDVHVVRYSTPPTLAVFPHMSLMTDVLYPRTLSAATVLLLLEGVTELGASFVLVAGTR